MSGCIHCEIHDLLESHIQSEDADLAEIASGPTPIATVLLWPTRGQGADTAHPSKHTCKGCSFIRELPAEP